MPYTHGKGSQISWGLPLEHGPLGKSPGRCSFLCFFTLTRPPFTFFLRVGNGKHGCSSDLGSGSPLRWVSNPDFNVEVRVEAGLRGPSTPGGGTQILITPSLSTALSTTQAQKVFWDYFSQSSADKGRVEQTQRQKLARDPA